MRLTKPQGHEAILHLNFCPTGVQSCREQSCHVVHICSSENSRSANVGVAFVGVLSEQERRVPHQGRRCRTAQRGQGLLRSHHHESSRHRSMLDFH